MQRRFFVVFGLLLAAAASPASADDIVGKVAWVPVSATGPHIIEGNRIVLPEGGVFVTLEIRVSDWDPDQDGDPLLHLLQIRLDQSGFDTGEAGRLSLEPIPCDASNPCPVAIICGGQVPGYCDVAEDNAQAWAFIDTWHPDYVFAGVPTLVVVDDALYRWGAMAFHTGDAVRDVGVSKYTGTLVVYVSPDAKGVFSVNSLRPGAETWLCSVDSCSGDDPTSPGPIVTAAEIVLGDDCNNNGVPDGDDVANGTSTDCNVNGRPDECEIDCNGNGIPDECDLLGGCSVDCDGNGVPDDCEPDCNANGVGDACDIDSGWSADCDEDGLPDECTALGQRDCNGNSTSDLCDVHAGSSSDCDEDDVLDECSLAAGNGSDCNANSVPDDCEPDCNMNGVADSCDITAGSSLDANGDGVPDECGPTLSLVPERAWSGYYHAGTELLIPVGGATVEVEGYLSGWDPNEDGDPGLEMYDYFIERASLSSGTTGTLVLAKIPCSQDADCRHALRCGVPDAGFCEVTLSRSAALYIDTARPDFVFAGLVYTAATQQGSLEFGGILTGTPTLATDDGTLRYVGTLLLDVPGDARGTFTLDFDGSYGLTAIITSDGFVWAGSLRFSTARITILDDCNENGVLDTDDIAGGTSIDCDGNGFPDECDLVLGQNPDCNGNLVLDWCESSEDCNGNGVVDFCDLLVGASVDANENQVPDECEAVTPISEAAGGRYLLITPTGTPDARVALKVTSPDFPCLEKFVTKTSGVAVLSDAPTYLPANEWGTVLVADDAIVPAATYTVEADHEDGVASDAAVLSTPLFGDLAPPFGDINFRDIAASVEAFVDGSCAVAMERADLFPAKPDGVLDFRDIAMVVLAYEGKPYPFAEPCP